MQSCFSIQHMTLLESPFSSFSCFLGCSLSASWCCHEKYLFPKSDKPREDDHQREPFCLFPWSSCRFQGYAELVAIRYNRVSISYLGFPVNQPCVTVSDTSTASLAKCPTTCYLMRSSDRLCVWTSSLHNQARYVQTATNIISEGTALRNRP